MAEQVTPPVDPAVPAAGGQTPADAAPAPSEPAGTTSEPAAPASDPSVAADSTAAEPESAGEDAGEAEQETPAEDAGEGSEEAPGQSAPEVDEEASNAAMANPEAPPPVVAGVTPNAADLQDAAVRLLQDVEAVAERAQSLLSVHEDYSELKDKLVEVANWLADKAGLKPHESGGYVPKQ